MSTFATIRDYVSTDADDTDDKDADNAPVAKTSADIVASIAGFIPSEGIVGYLTAFAIADASPKYSNFGVGVVALVVGLIAISMFGLSALLSVPKRSRKRRRTTGLMIGITLVLFVLYVSLLPKNLFESIPWCDPSFALLATLIANLALGIFGGSLKKLR